MTFEGDIILAGADDSDKPVVFAVLSSIQKRKRIPDDESTLVERADWIGEETKLETGPAIFIDAVKWLDIWYVQYVKVEREEKDGEDD
jgi:hypothetical protein